MPVAEDVWIKPHDQSHEDYYSQAGDLHRLMTEDQKYPLASNIAGGLRQANYDIQQRMLEQIEQADLDYRLRIETKLTQ